LPLHIAAIIGVFIAVIRFEDVSKTSEPNGEPGRDAQFVEAESGIKHLHTYAQPTLFAQRRQKEVRAEAVDYKVTLFSAKFVLYLI
jgi:hypothetical protein